MVWFDCHQRSAVTVEKGRGCNRLLGAQGTGMMRAGL